MRTNAFVLFSLTFGFLCMSAAFASAQDLLPLPAGMRVAERADAPVTVTLNGVQMVSRDQAALNYSVTNLSRNNIRALVIVGPTAMIKYSAILGAPLRPGAAEAFNAGSLLTKKVRNPYEIAVDFVLFDDGTTWGPNSTGDGDQLIGVYDGQKAAYTDAIRFTEAANERDVMAWLHSEDIARNPPGIGRILNKKWRAGYLYGYTEAHELFKRDYERRGLFSIGLRLRAMERDLGMPSREATAVKP